MPRSDHAGGVQSRRETGDAPTDTDASDGPRTPGSSGEMLPTTLYLAEVVMLPLFWLAPLMALVVGGATANDVGGLEDYGVEFDGSPWVWYLAPFVLSHLGSLGYKAHRRKTVRKHLGLTPTEMSHLVDMLDPPKGYPVRGLLVLQGLLPVTVFLAPEVGPLPDVVNLVVLALFVFGLIAAPPAVWLDLRKVREIPEVRWGWPRHLHVVCSLVPFALFVYLHQREEHVHYALFARVWEADLSTLSVPEEKRTSWLGRLADRLD